MECCLPILCSSRKGSRLIPHALKCILYWWITIYDSRWYICVHVCVYMCVCACKCIYLKVAIWHYVHPNMAKEKSSELEKVLFLLVSFYQKIEKVIHFHLSYFLSSPLFFFGTCTSFIATTAAGLFTNPKWLATTWLNPGLLLMIFKLRWACLALTSYKGFATKILQYVS